MESAVNCGTQGVLLTSPGLSLFQELGVVVVVDHLDFEKLEIQIFS